MIVSVDENVLSECLRTIRESFMTVAAEFSLTPENCPTNGAFIPLSRLENDYRKGDRMFALYEDGRIVGFVQLAMKGNNIFELEKLSVLPEYRHRGFGKQLVHFARDTARTLGGSKIVIGIIEENQRLRSWYEQNGFVHTGTKLLPHLPFTVGFMEMTL